MQNFSSYISRDIEPVLRKGLKQFPAVALLGPRQSGKSTLARQVTANCGDAVHLDLEYPPDRDKLTDPALYLPTTTGNS